MRSMNRWTKVLFVFVTVIIAIRIGYIAFRGEIDKEYYISESYTLNEATCVPCVDVVQVFSSGCDRLDSLELIVANIPPDKAGALILAIHSGDELIYQTNIALAGLNDWEWKRIFVNAKLASDQEYQLTLTSDEKCTQVPELIVVENDFAPEITASYANGQSINGQIAVRYGYTQPPSVLDKGVMIFLWAFLWSVISVGLLYFDVLLNIFKRWINYAQKQMGQKTFALTFEIFSAAVIVNCSGIPFQATTKIVFFAISVIVVMNIEKKKAYVRDLADVPWKQVAVIFLYLYAAFALVGQRIFIYPLTLKVTFAGIFVFTCAVIWFVPVVQSILYYMEKGCSGLFSKKRSLKIWQFVLFSAVALIFPAMITLFAFNPGMSSYDTEFCMTAPLQGSNDWHPAFYRIILRVIQTVWDSTYAVILVQHIFWGFVIIELLLYLRKKGMKDLVLITVALFMGLHPGNLLHINTIWKDIPYTISLLWALIILAKLYIDQEEYKHKWIIYFELIAALVGIFFYRKNGIVPFIVIIVSLILVLRKNIKILISIAFSLLLIITIKGPVYRYFEISDAGVGGMYIGLGQDILGVYYSGGEISESTLQMINVMTDYNNADYPYNPTYARQSYNLDVEPKEFVFNYIDTFVKNPVTMLRAVVAREDALWDIFTGQEAALELINYTYSLDQENLYWKERYGARQYVSLYPIMLAATSYTESNQWIAAIVWRNGLFTLLGLISFLFLLFKDTKGNHLFLIGPVVGQIMSLLLSTGWSDQRYFWPCTLLNQTMALLVFVVIHNKENAKSIVDQNR